MGSMCYIKPMNGKIVQTTLWKSDQLIVLTKQGNACGGKGLAGVRWFDGGTLSIPGDGLRSALIKLFKFDVSTKLAVITLRAREDPKCKFTSLAHLLTADFLKLKRT